MSGRRVGQHQGVFRFFVFVEVVNPFLLQKPADKVVVAFPVLNTLFPRRVASLQLEFDIAETPILKNFLGDIDYTLVLEDPAILGLRQKPEPRDNRHAIDEVTAMNRSPIEFDGVTVKVTFFAIRDVECDPNFVSKDLVRV